MDLKFDDMEINTNLAKEYLENNKEFHSFGPKYDENVEAISQHMKLDMQTYKLLYTMDLKNVVHNRKTENTGLSKTVVNYKFNELASKIQENSNLFVQLEYLLRNRPIEDSRLEIELLMKQLRCCSNNNGYSILTMSTGAPLLSLGCVAGIMKSNINIILATSSDTAVISYLFTKLCHEVGLGDIYLIITTDTCIAEIRHIPNNEVLDYSKFAVANSWSLGVITEQSDVDSALDVFITCSIKSPWKLRKIFVQESVYQQFKDALSWKCSLKGRADDEISSRYRELCPDVFRFEDRVFLLDYIRSTSPPQLLPEVVVEAYRTTKELLSLVRKYKPFYLSLWANDVAESNEVAHTVESRVVWINCFADFRGPARASNVIYDITRTRLVKKTKIISELNKLTESWLKLEMAERRQILSKVIIKSEEPIGDGSECRIDELNELNNDKGNGFVEVGKDYICMGIAQPTGILKITSLKESLLDEDIFDSILLGNAFVTDKNDALVKSFEDAGIPAIYAELEDGTDCTIHFGIDNVTKVICSNIGTIFAN